MDKAMQPVALLVPPEVVEIGKAGHGAPPATLRPTRPLPRTRGRRTLRFLRRVFEARRDRRARKALGREPVIHATVHVPDLLPGRPAGEFLHARLRAWALGDRSRVVARDPDTPTVFSTAMGIF